MRAISYTRVSTEGQAQEGVSLDAQAEAIRRYAAYKGMEIVGEIVDAGISGGFNDKRPGFIRLLEMVVNGEIEAIILFSLERLSRDMLTLLALERLLHDHNVEIHTTEGKIDTASPDGFMAFAMKAFLGEMERRQVKHRTKKALLHKKAQGQVVGSIPYGYQREGDALIPVVSEQKIISRARALHAQGYRLGHITGRLNAEGHVTRKGTPWTPQQTKRLLDTYQETRKATTKLTDAAMAFIKVIA